MLFIVRMVLAIFCPIVYFVVQEVVWPQLPLRLGPARNVVKLIIAAPPCPAQSPCPQSTPFPIHTPCPSQAPCPSQTACPALPPRPRWSPAVTEQCVNVFSGEYIIEHGMPPENELITKTVAQKNDSNLLTDYLRLDAFNTLCACIIALLLMVIVLLYLNRKGSKATSIAEVTEDATVQSGKNNVSPDLLVTTELSPTITIEPSSLDLLCLSCQLNEKTPGSITDVKQIFNTMTGFATKLDKIERFVVQLEPVVGATAEQTKKSSPDVSVCGEECNRNVTKIEILQQRVQVQSGHINKLQAQCDQGDKHEQTILDLQTTINKRGKEHKEEISRLSRTHHEEIDTLDKELEVSKCSHAAAQAAADDLNRKLSSSLNYNKATMTSKDTLQHSLDIKTEDLRKKHVEAENLAAQLKARKTREHELNDKLSAIEKTLAVKDQKIKSLSDTLKKKEQELTEIEKDQLEQSNELGEVYAMQTELKNKLKTTNTRHATLEAEFSSFRSAAATKVEACDQMKREKAAAEARAIAAEAALAKQQTANGSDQKAAAQKETQVQQLTEEVIELRKTSKKVEKLESDLVLKQKIIEQSKQNAATVKLGLQKELSEVQVQKADLEKELEQVKAKAKAEVKQSQHVAIARPAVTGPSCREVELESLVKNRDAEISQLKQKHELALKAATQHDDKQDFIEMLRDNHAAEKHELQLKASTANYENYLLEREIEKLQAELQKVNTTTNSSVDTQAAAPVANTTDSSKMKNNEASIAPHDISSSPAPAPGAVIGAIVTTAKPSPSSKSDGIKASKWAVDSSSTTPIVAATPSKPAATESRPAAQSAVPTTPAPALPPVVTPAAAPASASSTFRSFADRTPSAPLPSYHATPSTVPKSNSNNSNSGGSSKKVPKGKGLDGSKWAH